MGTVGRHVCGPLNTHESGGVQGPCRNNGKEKGGELNQGRWVAKYGDGWLGRDMGG